MIYFIIRDFWGKGGTEKVAQTLAEKFYKKEKKIKIITSGKRIFRKKIWNEIIVIELFSPNIKYIGTLFYYFFLTTYLFLTMRQYKVILVFFLKHSAFISIFISKILGKKVICRIAGTGKYGDIQTLKKIKFHQILLYILRKADKYITLTECMKKELLEEKFDPKKIEIIPNGVDIKKFRPPDNKEILKEKIGIKKKKILVFIGRLSEEKGLKILLKAIKNDIFKNTLLYIVGKGYLETELNEFVKTNCITDRVVFTGFKQDVVPFLQVADVFVLPSISEGFSNALLESMATGLPVVATKVSGNIDIIENGINGFLVEPENSEELAKALEKILKDENLARKMGEENRRKIVENYSIDKIVEKYIALYNNLISKSIIKQN
ncbi:MAG TPA: glycosyltransferase family 4 protein [bacterium]|nr:glycosyltransferase family 4 protein [bacterium]